MKARKEGSVGRSRDAAGAAKRMGRPGRPVIDEDKSAFAIGVANGGGVLLVVALGYLYELSLTGWILGLLLVSGLTNILLAWNNERRIAAGRARSWNEIVGKPVVACRRFQCEAGEYKGVVQLGSERWRAVSKGPVSEGQTAVVAGRRGLVLEVEP